MSIINKDPMILVNEIRKTVEQGIRDIDDAPIDMTKGTLELLSCQVSVLADILANMDIKAHT